MSPNEMYRVGTSLNFNAWNVVMPNVVYRNVATPKDESTGERNWKWRRDERRWFVENVANEKVDFGRRRHCPFVGPIQLFPAHL